MSPHDPWYQYNEAGKWLFVSLENLDINEIANLYEQMDPIY